MYVSESELRRGIKVYKRGNYEEALRILGPLAEADVLEAQRVLSRMYFAGQGVDPEREKYLYWLARAGDNGDPAARSKLKRSHKDGELSDYLLRQPSVRRVLRLP